MFSDYSLCNGSFSAVKLDGADGLNPPAIEGSGHFLTRERHHPGACAVN